MSSPRAKHRAAAARELAEHVNAPNLVVRSSARVGHAALRRNRASCNSATPAKRLPSARNSVESSTAHEVRYLFVEVLAGEVHRPERQSQTLGGTALQRIHSVREIEGRI